MSAARRARAGAVAIAAAVAACWGQGGAAAQGLGATYDPSLPIEITADSLEVLQRDQVAVFSGSVDAVQGDFVLSADRVRVHYRGADGAAAGEQQGTASAAAAGGVGPEGGVRRIEAEGNVFLSSPEETAQGAEGVYDVENGEVTLTGDVVLTRGDNVVRGERLVVDLNAGRARVTAAAPGQAGAAAEQRVRAIFVPGGGPQQQDGR